MSAASRPLEDDQQGRIRRQAEMALADRIRPGALFYPLVAAVVALATDLGADHPIVAYGGVGGLVVLAFLRSLAADSLANGDLGGLRRVRVTVVLLALGWTAFATFVIATYGRRHRACWRSSVVSV